MHKASSTVRLRHAAMPGFVFGIALLSILLLPLLLSGCESTGNWLRGRKTHDAEPLEVGTSETNQYLHELSALVGGDPATQAEIYADAKAAAELTPGPDTKLRYALVLATPGHAGTNELEAQSLFRELLAQTNLLRPEEISIASIHLNEVEQRLVLGAENRRLRSENSRSARTEEAAIEQRIATVEVVKVYGGEKGCGATVNQMRGPCNAILPKATQNKIRQWVKHGTWALPDPEPYPFLGHQNFIGGGGLVADIDAEIPF